MAGIWHHAGCCCGKPCVDCTGAQPAATVTIAGSNADCHEEYVAGSYSWSHFTDDNDHCGWTWDFGNENCVSDFGLILTYCKTDKKWCAYIVTAIYVAPICCISFGYVDGGGDCPCGVLLGTEVAGLSCVNGKVTGDFELLGDGPWNAGACDCTGVTASVSVG